MELFLISISGSVQSLSHVQLFPTPQIAACHVSLFVTNSLSSLILTLESLVPSNHLILCHPLLLLSSIFPSIRVLSSESVLCITWPKYWSFSFSISPSERLLLNYKKTLGFLASRGEEFDLGPEMRLDHSELLCNKVLLKCKGDRESF